MKAALSDIFGEKQVPPKVALDDAARQLDEVLRAAPK